MKQVQQLNLLLLVFYYLNYVYTWQINLLTSLFIHLNVLYLLMNEILMPFSLLNTLNLCDKNLYIKNLIELCKVVPLCFWGVFKGSPPEFSQIS